MRNRAMLKYIAAGFIAFPLFTAAVSAHSTGESLERVVNGYLIDIGYDETEILTGEPVRFGFNLLNESAVVAGGPAEFTDLWVRFSRDSQTVFAGGINNPALGLPGVIYTFDQPGDYELYVRYHNGDEVLVEESFSVPVGGAENSPQSSSAAITIILAGAIGLVGGFLAGIIKQSKHPGQ